MFSNEQIRKHYSIQEVDTLVFKLRGFVEIFNLVMVAILIAFTGFFVAAEFAIVKIRSSRIDQLVAEGKRGALAAKK